MAIVQGELLYKYTGAGAHDGVQASGDASLGGYRASSNISTGVDNNLFDDVSGAEAVIGHTDYRAVGFVNTNGALALTACVTWIAVDTGNAEDDIKFDTEAPSVSETTGAIQTIGNETTEPAAPDWQDGTTKGTGQDCPLGDNEVGSGEWFGIWFKRIISGVAAAKAAETVTIRVEGDTAE